jgi:hypothetical protein
MIMATKTPSMTMPMTDSVVASQAAGVQVPSVSKVARPWIAERLTWNESYSA